jgi:hypothetical protein
VRPWRIPRPRIEGQDSLRKTKLPDHKRKAVKSIWKHMQKSQVETSCYFWGTWRDGVFHREPCTKRRALADKNVLCRIEHTTPCLHGVPAIFESDKTICIPKPTKTYYNKLLLMSGNGNQTTATTGAARQ